ncbi:MAG: PAS domain-containing protein [Candidatus Bathyarchaeota archaeon]|nr:PAS domain-containing protein [Candidatus Bathyarchaeota archaeon]
MSRFLVLMSLESSYRDLIPLFDVFNEAMLIYDSEQIHWVNDALVVLLEYNSMEEIIGKNIISFLHPESQQEGTHQLKRLYQGVKRTGGIYTALKKNRTPVSVVSRGTQLPGTDETLLISIVRPVEEDPVEEGRIWSDFKFKHEVSTSITVIKGYTELIQKRVESHEGSELGKWFKTIFENIERIEKILLELT